MLIDLSSPVRSAIIVYFLLMTAVLIYKPKLLGDNRRAHSLLSILIVVISIMSYYLLAVLQWFRS